MIYVGRIIGTFENLEVGDFFIYKHPETPEILMVKISANHALALTAFKKYEVCHAYTMDSAEEVRRVANPICPMVTTAPKHNTTFGQLVIGDACFIESSTKINFRANLDALDETRIAHGGGKVIPFNIAQFEFETRGPYSCILRFDKLMACDDDIPVTKIYEVHLKVNY